MSDEGRKIYEIKAQTTKQKAFDNGVVFANVNWHVGTRYASFC